MIVKSGEMYMLKSHAGKSMGKYPSRKAAMKRERQVNFFKLRGAGGY